MRTTPKQYAQALYDLTDGKPKTEIEKSLVNFARYLYKEKKLWFADKIIEQFAVIYNEKKGIIETEIISRKKLGEIELKKVKHFIKKKYQAKGVISKNTIDERVKGGLIIKIGDKIIDGSVKGKLEELRKILV